LHKEKIIPGYGVYCVKVEVEGKIVYGMMNIGIRPTFGLTSDRIIEVNLFGVDTILYGKTLRISFLCRLRDEKKFSSPNELVDQLKHDRESCQSVINEKYKT
jgi:riboflavin kinase/FMN adenylyltransferase